MKSLHGVVMSSTLERPERKALRETQPERRLSSRNGRRPRTPFPLPPLRPNFVKPANCPASFRAPGSLVFFSAPQRLRGLFFPAAEDRDSAAGHRAVLRVISP